MSDHRSPDKQKSELEVLSSVEVSGKNLKRWEEKEPRFIKKLTNSFRQLFGGDIKPEITANNELLDAADNLVKSAQEAIQSPQVKNSERQASIKLKYAEVKEKEANARKTNLEADLLQVEVDSVRHSDSEGIIQRLIQRGELIPIERDGELFLVYRKRNT